MEELKYNTGFDNFFATEAKPGALPEGRNNPQQAPFGLYAEQISGDAFTALPHDNLRSWLYRRLPSVSHGPYKSVSHDEFLSSPDPENTVVTPAQLRWSPAPIPNEPLNFVDGIRTVCLHGEVGMDGCAVHLYLCNRSMANEAFYNADGDLLIVPQMGTLLVVTEMGRLRVQPKEIAVIPRGIKFKVQLEEGKARGYICENYGGHFKLPYRSVIGANGLANERDFQYPLASFESNSQQYKITAKFSGQFFELEQDHSPFDVVAWHGNYAPFKYDLTRFNTIGTISFDHPDPSIFTVLSSPSAVPGVANVDFVIFPPRWMVAEGTFRPPYFHRNIMSEYMGLIHGVYDAKPAGGFEPGGGSLHNCMTAHGPDAGAFEGASKANLKPEYLGDTLAFMFESRRAFQSSRWALSAPELQQDYNTCWAGLKPQFLP